jgi:hypothetical protein
MKIKENIHNYNLDDHATCKNLAIELHGQLKKEEKNSAALISCIDQLNELLNGYKTGGIL